MNNNRQSNIDQKFVLKNWLNVNLVCVECTASLQHFEDRLECSNCRAIYPIANGVPMLLNPNNYLDTAAKIAEQLGGLDIKSVERALGSANRYLLKDMNIMNEFSCIVERYFPSMFSAESERTLNSVDKSFSLVSHYFNETFERGKSSYRSFRIKNNTNQTLSTSGSTPYHLSYWITDTKGKRHEGCRSSFPVPLKPGKELTIPVRIDAPNSKGKFKIEILVVQEFVKWYDDSPIFVGEINVVDKFNPIEKCVTPPHNGFFDFEEDLKQCGKVIEQSVALVRSTSQNECPIILEIACGSDPQAIRHYQNNTCVIACDLAFPQAQLASLATKQRGSIDEGLWQFLSADVFAMPFKPNSFDIVLISAAFHHFSDTIHALKIMKSLIKPTGHIILLREPCKVVPNDEKYIEELQNGFNEQQFDIAEYEKMYETAGLTPLYEQIDFECSYKAILKTK